MNYTVETAVDYIYTDMLWDNTPSADMLWDEVVGFIALVWLYNGIWFYSEEEDERKSEGKEDE